MAPAPDLLGSRQVCERIGIDRSTLSRYVQLARIEPALRLPGPKGAMLFHPEDVAALEGWYHGERLTEKAS